MIVVSGTSVIVVYVNVFPENGRTMWNANCSLFGRHFADFRIKYKQKLAVLQPQNRYACFVWSDIGYSKLRFRVLERVTI